MKKREEKVFSWCWVSNAEPMLGKCSATDLFPSQPHILFIKPSRCCHHHLLLLFYLLLFLSPFLSFPFLSPLLPPPPFFLVLRIELRTSTLSANTFPF